jgi:hypothetical protein
LRVERIHRVVCNVKVPIVVRPALFHDSVDQEPFIFGI